MSPHPRTAFRLQPEHLGPKAALLAWKRHQLLEDPSTACQASWGLANKATGLPREPLGQGGKALDGYTVGNPVW